MTEFARLPKPDLTAVGSLAGLRDVLAALPPPTIVFNKSHSGSRVLAGLLSASGVYMGPTRPESNDALALLPFVEYCVEKYYPDYGAIVPGSDADAALARVAAGAFAQHLAAYRSGPWGWKLCEAGYALPILLRLFPQARCIHLIRDGRDAAFANHVAPRTTFWRKVYVDDPGIRIRGGLVYGRFSRTLYRLVPHRYNVQHWINSVTTFRRYTSGLGDRLLEVRYEDLTRDFVRESQRICAFAGAPRAAEAIAALAPTIKTSRVGRHRLEARWKQRDVLRRATPLLEELGYLDRH
jgi:hypothetical protein